MQDEIRRLPDNISRAERTLFEEQEKYEKVLTLQPLTDRIEKLKIDIPKLKQTLKLTEEKLSTALTDSEELELAVAEPNSNKELANSMLGDMTLLDEANKDSERIRQELSKLKATLPTRTTTLTMDEAQKQRQTVNVQCRKEHNELELMQSKHDQELEMINTLREKRAKLTEERNTLNEGVQSLNQLKERKEEIGTQIEKILNEMKIFDGKLEPLKLELREAIESKDKNKKINRDKLSEATDNVNKLKQLDNDINR